MSDTSIDDRVVVEPHEGTEMFRVRVDGATSLNLASREEAEEYATASRAALRRQSFVDGLRELADFLEETPAAPTPRAAYASRDFWTWASEEETADRFAEAALAFDRGVSIDGQRVKATRLFGPVKFEITIDAKEICEKREVTVPREEFVLPTSLRAEAA